MGHTLAQIDTWLVALVLALAMFAAWGVGWRSGRRLRPDDEKPPGFKFDDASLALLGLLLAFTFSMAIGRHDQRRLMVVADSNAIGDFYTCASLLKEPVRTKLRTVTRDYAELRLDIALRRLEDDVFVEALRRSQLMQGQMTDLVAEALAEGTPIAVPLTNTLNNLTSMHASRLVALHDRLPESIVLLLFTAAIVSTMLVGREQGVSRKPEFAGTGCFILLVTLAVYVTLDLNQPSSGLIRVSQEPLQRLLASMAQ